MWQGSEPSFDSTVSTLASYDYRKTLRKRQDGRHLRPIPGPSECKAYGLQTEPQTLGVSKLSQWNITEGTSCEYEP